MLKVFLVEDEFIVREGIKKNIDWEKHGYDFCGEAGDGERAFPLIQKLSPDIVITDIKMPFMDGLELSKLIKAKMPWIEIIILSGYSEFEYAKEAIRIGVAEYVSKPVNGEELINIVNGLAEKIEEKNKEREINEKYKQEMEENTNAHKKRLFNYLVTGTKTVPELLEKGEKVGIDLTAACYNIILFRLQGIGNGQGMTMEEGEALLSEITAHVKSQNVDVFDRNLEGVALLLKGDSEEQIIQLQKETIEKIENYLKEKNHTEYFGGIGQIVGRMSALPESFEKAAGAFAHRYFVKENCFLDYASLENMDREELDDFDIFNIDTKQIDRSKITNFLKQGDIAETNYFVEEFCKGAGTKAFESVLFRQYISMDVYFCVVEFAENYGFDKNDINQPDMNTVANGSGETIKEYLEKLICGVLKLRDNAANNRYRDVVNEVKNYIQKNYADENLSLNELARYVGFSPNHLSAIFAQETGQTFIKYLTDYRINKSKELLRCTGYKSSEISIMVGYKDPHYFSFLFKKTQGVTPTQYREGKTE